MIRTGLLAALAVMFAAQLVAQQVNPAVTERHGSANHGIAHYGKWASAVLAVAFTGLAAREHASSDDAFRQLLDICRGTPSRCTLGAGGSYTDPTSEDFYQASVHHERQARVRLLAGQASLLLAAGLFLADHGGHDGGPGNIPYHARVLVEQRANGTQVGLRFRF